MFDNYVEWFESLDFYKDYIAKWDQPFNNPFFMSGVFIVVCVIIALVIMDNIKTWLYKHKSKIKAREREKDRIEREEKIAKQRAELEKQRIEAEAASLKQGSLLKEFSNFMMVVQAQNMTSLKGLTFEQWQSNKDTIAGVQRQPVVENSRVEEPVAVQQEQKKTPVPDTPITETALHVDKATVKPTDEVVETKTATEPAESEETMKKKYWTDSVTGLLTRTAYEQIVKKIEADRLCIISIDANDLKKTNDTIGHEEGDRLLKGIADTMCDVWGSEKCYRVGGDEFSVLLSSANRRVVERNIQAFKDILSDIHLSAAVGFADASDVKGKVTERAIAKASDEVMYADKKAFKQARIDKELAEKIAEEQCRKEEQERIQKEQEQAEKERLKAEKEEKERETAEQERIVSERKAVEEKARQEELLKNIDAVTPESEYEIVDVESEPDLPAILETIKEDTPDQEEKSVDIGELLHVMQEETIATANETTPNTEITDEQQSDFTKAIALIQAQKAQKKQLETYNQKRSEIAKANIETLDKTLQKNLEGVGTKKQKQYVSTDDEVEKRKKEALAAIEGEEKAKQEGKKKGIFNKKK